MIDFKNNKGGIPIALLWSILFFIVIISCTFVIEQYYMNVRAEIVKDALTFSALSVYKDIDKGSLDKGSIVLSDQMKNTFKKYLIKNLNLNDNLSSRPNSVVSGNVSIDTMNIYNIDSAVEYYPDGSKIIFKPSLFVRINYQIEPILKGILGNKKNVSTSTVVELH